MIATVQFDLSSPEDAAKFAMLIGPPVATVTTDAPEYEKATKPKRESKAKTKEEPLPEPDPALEFPPKEDDTPVMPSIEDISKLFAKCQEKDAKASGLKIKAFLDSQKAKSVRDLDDMQRFELKRELQSILFDPFG